MPVKSSLWHRLVFSPTFAVVLVLVLLTTFAALRYNNFLGAYNVSSVLR